MRHYEFEAAVQRSTGWGAFVLFPHRALKEFHTAGRVPVQSRFDDLSYAGALMPHGEGYHRLAVPHAILQKLGKGHGDLIRVELWRDEAPRRLDLPEDLIALLHREALWDAFDNLPLSRRKEYRNWIHAAKRPETRQRRLSKAVALLRAETGSQASDTNHPPHRRKGRA